MYMPGATTAIKRFFDIVLSLIAIIILSPIMLITALVVLLNLGSPILFRQTRAGLNGKPFAVLKFRTMLDASGADGKLLPDEKRLTSTGKALRESSLDELPQLFNVLVGDMSLVGPRPLPTAYLPRYSPRQSRRHEVKPGITGWAQVNGRNDLSWEEKFDLDVWYVDNWSLALDLRILFMTVGKAFKREGISAEGCATMPEFMGSEELERD
jgi:lipopolysaccharide/colanic/teichoic acid biosynthesis glycosyltransferase